MAELMARALRMELEAPHKPGLVDPCSNGAHSDMDYDLMKGSIEVIRRSFVRHLPSLMGMYSSLGEALTSFGKEIEADVLAFTGGINTYRGAIFSLGLTSIAALELASTAHHSESDTLHQGACGGQAVDYQSNSSTDPGKNGGVKTPNIFSDSVLGATASEGWFTPEELSEAIARLATGIEPVEGTHGARAVNEYAVKGALQMARDGYKPLFEDWLPFYRTTSEADPWRLQKTLLRIMSELDDTCVIHRVGYQRALEVKEESKRLLEGFTPEGLKEMKERYDAEGISPGGAADMLALTILVDSLLPRDGRQEATDDESDIKDI